MKISDNVKFKGISYVDASLYFLDSSVYIYRDISGNLIFTDKNNSQKTLANLANGETYTFTDFLTKDSSNNVKLGGSSYNNSVLSLYTPAAPSFDISNGFNGGINSVIIDGSGKFLIGGTFTTYKGLTQNRLIRLNPDGTKDTTFDISTGFNDAVNVIKIDADNKILVGGNFGGYMSRSARGLIRLNTNGTQDVTFDMSVGFNSQEVNNIAIDNNGKIIVVGNYTIFQGLTQNRIIRLNSDGTKDITFDASDGFTNPPRALAIDSSNRILTGGNFSSYRGEARHFFMRILENGMPDNNFISYDAMGWISVIYDIKIDSSNYIFIGGDFDTVYGIPRPSIARFTPDGSLDSFNPSTNVMGNYPTVYSIVFDISKNIIIGGDNIPSNIVRFKPSGEVDTSFDVSSGFNNTVKSIVIDSSQRIICGGNFITYRSHPQKYLISLNPNGWPYMYYDLSTNINITKQGLAYEVNYFNLNASNNRWLIDKEYNDQYIRASNFLTKTPVAYYTYDSADSYANIKLGGISYDDAVLTYKNIDPCLGFIGNYVNDFVTINNRTIIGGYFSEYKGTYITYIVELDKNRNLITSVFPKWQSGQSLNEEVKTINVDASQKIILGGKFTSYKGSTVNKIMRLNTDGSVDSTFITGTGFGTTTSHIVRALQIDSSGNYLIAGNLLTYKGVTIERMIKLKPNGDRDVTFGGTGTGSGFGSSPYVVTLDSSQNMFVGGVFTTYKTKTQNYFVKLLRDGSVDTSFDVSTYFNNNVYTCIIDSSGKIIVGGMFTTYKGLPQNRLIRLNPDGTKDTTFDIGTGFNNTIWSVTIDPSNRILVGGNYTTYKDVSQNRLIRLNPDGTKDTTFDIGTGFDNEIFKIYIESDEHILVGGRFFTYKGKTDGNNEFIRLNFDGTKTDEDIDIQINKYGLTYKRDYSPVNANNNRWIPDKQYTDTKLSKTGDTMSGALNIGNFTSLNPYITPGNSSTAYIFDTSTTLISGDYLFELNNNTVPAFYVDYQGKTYGRSFNAYSSSTNYSALNLNDIKIVTLGGNTRVLLNPTVSDGSTVAFMMDTDISLTSSKLLSLRNYGIEKLYVDASGTLYASDIHTTLQIPTTSTSAGITGSMVNDTSYLYVCISSNMWARTLLSTW